MGKYNGSAIRSVYFGTGKNGFTLLENIQKKAKANGKSVSETILKLLREADPTLFRGVDRGAK